MAVGLMGRKCGMTRLFTEEGLSVSVTVIEVIPNRITQIKSKKSDGYQAIQVAYGNRRANLINKPMSGHLAKAGVEAGRGLWEFRLKNQEEIEDKLVGNEIKVDIFIVGQKVDITGITKGKGFAGTVKRHHFKTQDASHGNSLSHRVPGSIGQNQTPGRVFKGKKMAGQMGNVRRTIQNIEIVRIDYEKNLLLVKGAVPGAPGGDVIIRSAIKSSPSPN
ncbi:50S ribosomal protein L3 [Candidatus Parabeggiatoa sp. HSG14]|uniref:50S ribosomal protein L3 n=1 Tax=Candidatus Parabeggiatoa sp. HSG14 TaxID=3055593 RepID=UPI0025A6CE50|nr:50S ribosomal protein L3 [Thiotrichales bacterium HSG14]